MKRRTINEEDTNPDISIRKSVFARMFPRIECWAENRKTVARLLEDAGRHEANASGFEGRGHWELAGRHLEKAAHAVEAAAFVSGSAKHQKRRMDLIRRAIVCYGAEIRTDGYDPGLHWKIHKLAALMQDKLLSLIHFKAAHEGFEMMIMNPELDNAVRLGRMKRKAVERMSENDMLGALDASCQALELASESRPEKVEATRSWIIGTFGQEGGGSEFYLKGVEDYVPFRCRSNGKAGGNRPGNRKMR